jgi:ribosome-associated toxin RatA of RatAB toxin-antitoxin module
MRQIRRSALVATTPQRMFALINDIASYPQFVPGCAAAEVLEQSADALRAKLTVGSGPLRTSFVTRNRLTADQRIDMQLDEGPLRSLQGVWTLTPVLQPQSGEVLGCRVELALDFELHAGLKGLAVGSVIERVATSLVDAFVKRATESAA